MQELTPQDTFGSCGNQMTKKTKVHMCGVEGVDILAEWRIVPRIFWDGLVEDRVGVTVGCGVLVEEDSGVGAWGVDGNLGTV